MSEQTDQTKDQYLRALADIENTKKRLARDRDEAAKWAAERIIRELLPILDSFGQALRTIEDARAQAHDEAATKFLPAVQAGVELIHRQLLALLAKEGVTPIEAVGRLFDHHRHEAADHVETDGHADGTVVEELQTGYLWHDKVLRPSLVKIAKKSRQETGDRRPETEEEKLG